MSMSLARKVGAVGVGIGPSNLSLAALAHKKIDMPIAFFDEKKSMQWHPGLLFPESLLQVSFLKDLVTLVDPSNPFSFLSYLADQGCLYRFANARFPSIKRKEFELYLQWMSRKLPNLYFNHPVEAVDFKHGNFTIHHTNGETQARHLVLGTGLSPKVPEFATPHLGNSVFHVINYCKHNVNLQNKRVAIIGGGQSGAEIFNRIIQKMDGMPKKAYWISSRKNFQPIDDSPFVNEYFTPGYSEYFYKLPLAERKQLIEEQVLASDGISENLLQDIYRQLYELEIIEKQPGVGVLLPDCFLTNLQPGNQGWKLDLKKSCADLSLDVDVVILATGFEYKVPDFMESIFEKINFSDNRFKVNPDYSIQWDGPSENRIYVQNATRLERGVADPNLSLMAWRSAMIINSMAEKPIYKTSESDMFLSAGLPLDENFNQSNLSMPNFQVA